MLPWDEPVRDAGLWWRPEWVGASNASMWGFLHGCEPEPYESELWVGVTLNGWRPMVRVPMKGALGL